MPRFDENGRVPSIMKGLVVFPDAMKVRAQPLRGTCSRRIHRQQSASWRICVSRVYASRSVTIVGSRFLCSQENVVSNGAYFSKSFTYFPYPSFTRSSRGMNLSAAEFMQ